MKIQRFPLYCAVWSAFLTLAFVSAPSASAQSGTLALAVTATPDPVKPGEQVTYAITATNEGSTRINDVRIRFVVPNYLSNTYRNPGDADGTADGTQYSIPAGQSHTERYSYIVSKGSTLSGTLPPADGTAITLTANVTANSGLAVRAVSNVIVAGTPVLSLDIGDTDADSVTPGQTFTYLLTYGNRGMVSIADAQLRVTLPVGVAFVSANGGGTLNGSDVLWGVGALPPGASGTRRLSVTAAAGTSARLLLATAEIHDATSAGIAARASDSTVVRPAPLIGLSVTATPDPVKPGEQVQYALTVTNLSTAPLNSTTISFVVPNYLSNAYVKSGAIDGTGSGTQYTILPGQSHTERYSYIVSKGSTLDGTSPPADGTVIRLTARATVYPVDNQREYADADTSVGIVVDSTPSLALDIGHTDADSAIPGQGITYVLTYANRGNTTVPNAVLNAALPTGSSLVIASDGGTVVNDQVQWNVGAVAPGVAGRRTFNINIPSGTGGSILMEKAEIHDATDALNTARSTDSAVLRTAPQLGLSVTATPDPVKPGEQVQYVLTVTNLGTAQLYNTSIAFTVPNYLSNAYVNPGDSDGTADGYSYSLAPGQSHTELYSYVVSKGSTLDGTVPPGDGTIIRLTARATAYPVRNYREYLDADTASVAVVVNSAPSLALEISDAGPDYAMPGQPLTYTLTYANRGSASIASAQLQTIVPAGSSFAAASDGGTAVGDEVTWSVGKLAPGASGTRQLTVTPGGGAANLLLATAEIHDSADAVESARATDSTVVRTAPLISLAVSSTPDLVKPGEQVQLSVTLTNRGTTQISNARLRFLVPNYLSNNYEKTGDNDGTAFGGQFSLAPGASRTDVYSYAVSTGSAADGTLPPADGTLLHFTIAALVDTVGGSDAAGPGSDISRTVVVRNAPVAAVGLPMVTLEAVQDGSESGQTGQIRLSRAGGDVNAELIVRVALAGTATNGSDYPFKKDTIKLKAGKTSKLVNFVPVDDALREGIEKVKVKLLADPAYTISSDAPAKVKIKLLDND